jgi:hypothetical protein
MSAELQELWADEAARRWRELETGEVEPVSADVVFRKARALLTRN